MHLLLLQLNIPMLTRVCPRCMKTRPEGQMCKTPSCQPFLLTPAYLRDEIEGNLHIAKTLLAEGDKEQDWRAAVRSLSKELERFDAQFGAMAFTQ